MDMLAFIPVKPFGVAKARLAPVLDARGRSRLGKAVATRTVQTAMTAGLQVTVLTADDGVARWAKGLGAEVLPEPPRSTGLSNAATAAVELAARRGVRWAIIHADLPLLTPPLVEDFVHAIPSGGHTLAPSYDGGTTILGGYGRTFPFSYGPASFGRHLRSAAAQGPVAVFVRTAVALDLDGPADLDAARRHPDGAWLEALGL